MHILTYKKSSGQLSLQKGYKILEFSINSSSVSALTENGSKIRLFFGGTKTVMICDVNNKPIIILGPQ